MSAPYPLQLPFTLRVRGRSTLSKKHRGWMCKDLANDKSHRASLPQTHTKPSWHCTKTHSHLRKLGFGECQRLFCPGFHLTELPWQIFCSRSGPPTDPFCCPVRTRTKSFPFSQPPWLYWSFKIHLLWIYLIWVCLSAHFSYFYIWPRIHLGSKHSNRVPGGNSPACLNICEMRAKTQHKFNPPLLKKWQIWVRGTAQ